MSKLRIGQARCKYCGIVTTTGGIKRHLKNCLKRPKSKETDVKEKFNDIANGRDEPLDSQPLFSLQQGVDIWKDGYSSGDTGNSADVDRDMKRFFMYKFKIEL